MARSATAAPKVVDFPLSSKSTTSTLRATLGAGVQSDVDRYLFGNPAEELSPAELQMSAVTSRSSPFPIRATTSRPTTKSPRRRARKQPMTDPVSQTEADLRAQLAEAKTDKKFSDLLGEFKGSQKEILGKIDLLTVIATEAKTAANDAKNTSIQTRWQTFFLVLGLFAAIVAVVSLVFANTQQITGLMQTVAAVQHK